jgi:hypothetical protein
MADIATDLKQRFDWAMDLCLESYEVLSDGRSFERSDRDEMAIDIFKDLRDSVDDIPLHLIKAMQTLRDAQPDQFSKALRDGIEVVGAGFLPASATEFVEVITKHCAILDHAEAKGLKPLTARDFRSTPDERTFVAPVGTSQKCQTATWQPYAGTTAPLLAHKRTSGG